MNEFQTRMHTVLTSFKRAHRRVSPTRFVLSEEDFLSRQLAPDDGTTDGELRIHGIPVVRGDTTHIE